MKHCLLQSRRIDGDVELPGPLYSSGSSSSIALIRVSHYVELPGPLYSRRDLILLHQLGLQRLPLTIPIALASFALVTSGSVQHGFIRNAPLVALFACLALALRIKPFTLGDSRKVS